MGPYYNNMKFEALGESAYLLRDLGAWDAARLCDAVAAAGIPGVTEAVCAYDTVAVYSEHGALDVGALAEWAAKTAPETIGAGCRRTHVVPVCYSMGPDLGSVCERLGLTGDEVRALHCSVEYRCFAVGFSPGFPYLGRLPEGLTGVPRMPSPRVRVPAGSVGITGTQTGIYPQETPGGWALIGRTPLELVNLREGYFPIAAGDCVKFEPIDERDFVKMEGSRL